MDFEIKKYGNTISAKGYSGFVMGVDVGGTNTRLAIAGVKGRDAELLFSIYYKSKEIASFETVLTQALTYCQDTYGIKVKEACIAAAGPVSSTHDYCKLTNLEWTLDAKHMLKKTPLKSIMILNDFEAVGYGIDLLKKNSKNDVLRIKPGEETKPGTYPTKAVIGAGTGLGKATLVHTDEYGGYIPVASEGGHADFPTYDGFDLDLVRFIKQQRKTNQDEPVSYEDILSGPGITSLYMFLKSRYSFQETAYTKKVDLSNDMPELISAYRHDDETCGEVFKLFAKYFGRAAKNFALNSMPTGGLYITGNISSKNKEVFMHPEFEQEFENNAKHKALLQRIPIFLVLDPEVNLLGACFAAIRRKDLAIKK